MKPLKKMKRAHIFPGQGSQFSGMGKSLYDSYAKARELMERANEILGFRLTDIMFHGSAEDLKSTAVTQPAVFLHSIVAEYCAEIEKPDMVAGHSLGEFSALVACGVLEFEDALKLVSKRASAMQECCEKHPGAMAAVIGLPVEEIENVCSEISSEGRGIVLAANYNSPQQTVISGEKESVLLACDRLKEKGAKRALMLNVSGAFHSPLMDQARHALSAVIDKYTFHTPSIPIYQNVSATAQTDPLSIKSNLLAQLTSSVRWSQTIRNMVKDGAKEFTEVGPGNVLQGLVSRIVNNNTITIKGIQ